VELRARRRPSLTAPRTYPYERSYHIGLILGCERRAAHSGKDAIARCIACGRHVSRKRDNPRQLALRTMDQFRKAMPDGLPTGV